VRLTRTLLTPSGQSDLYSKASVYSFQEQSRAKKLIARSIMLPDLFNLPHSEGW